MLSRICIFLCLATLIGCKKKQESQQSSDQIVFYEFDPAQEITSVDSIKTIQIPFGQYDTPYPSDSSANYQLDIDGDSVSDFNFLVEHRYHFVSASHPQSNWWYRMSISGVHPISGISATTSSGFYVTKFYDFGKSIHSGGKWLNEATLINTAAPGYGFSGTKYIGLRIAKIFNNYGAYTYCWLKISIDPVSAKNKLLIESLGYNKTYTNAITAGQEE